MNARSSRWESLAGVAAIVAWLIAVLVIEGSRDTGEETPAELVAYFEGEDIKLYIGGLIFFIGSALLIWFGGVLRSVIAATGYERLASIAFGATVALAVATVGLVAPQLSAAFAGTDSDQPLTPAAAQALWFAGDGFVAALGPFAAALVAAVGLWTLRSRALPAWFGWLSLVVALALVIPFVHWFATFFVVPLWILLVSWFLWRTAEPEAVVHPTPTA